MANRRASLVFVPFSETPPGTADTGSVAMGMGTNAAKEITEWQAVMDYLRTLPVKRQGELPTIPLNERAAEVRAIRVG